MQATPCTPFLLYGHSEPKLYLPNDSTVATGVLNSIVELALRDGIDTLTIGAALGSTGLYVGVGPVDVVIPNDGDGMDNTATTPTWKVASVNNRHQRYAAVISIADDIRVELALTQTGSPNDNVKVVGPVARVMPRSLPIESISQI